MFDYHLPFRRPLRYNRHRLSSPLGNPAGGGTHENRPRKRKSPAGPIDTVLLCPITCLQSAKQVAPSKPRCWSHRGFLLPKCSPSLMFGQRPIAGEQFPLCPADRGRLGSDGRFRLHRRLYPGIIQAELGRDAELYIDNIKTQMLWQSVFTITSLTCATGVFERTDGPNLALIIEKVDSTFDLLW